MNKLTKDRDGDRDMFKILMLVAQAIVIPACGAVIITLSNVKDRLVRVETKIEIQTANAKELYTTNDAAADRRLQAEISAAQNAALGRHQAAIDDIKSRVRAIEQDNR